MRKYFTWAAVAIILIVLPIGSYIYLKRGFEFQKQNFAEMELLGTMPYDSLVRWDPGLNAVWLSGDVHVVAFYTPGNRIDLGTTLLTLQEQYATVSHFQLIGMADNVDAMPELATYKIVSSNPNLPSIRSRFPTYFGPDVLTLIDSKDEIRSTYHWRNPEELKKMVTHIALLLPKKLKSMSQPDLKLARKLNVIAYIVSFVVLLLVALMRQFKFETEVDFSILPPFHATLNALTAVILVLAYIAVKRKKISLHRKLMITALITSLIFLVSYVLYHITTEETRFCQPGAIRYVYFFLLMTHILLAAVSFPLVLFTFIRGYTGQIVQHRKMARWVYPLWLYVAITGPVCYLMLMPCYS